MIDALMQTTTTTMTTATAAARTTKQPPTNHNNTILNITWLHTKTLLRMVKLQPANHGNGHKCHKSLKSQLCTCGNKGVMSQPSNQS